MVCWYFNRMDRQYVWADLEDDMSEWPQPLVCVLACGLQPLAERQLAHGPTRTLNICCVCQAHAGNSDERKAAIRSVTFGQRCRRVSGAARRTKPGHVRPATGWGCYGVFGFWSSGAASADPYRAGVCGGAGAIFERVWCVEHVLGHRLADGAVAGPGQGAKVGLARDTVVAGWASCRPCRVMAPAPGSVFLTGEARGAVASARTLRSRPCARRSMGTAGGRRPVRSDRRRAAA